MAMAPFLTTISLGPGGVYGADLTSSGTFDLDTRYAARLFGMMALGIQKLKRRYNFFN
jgi:hypothetical protein